MDSRIKTIGIIIFGAMAVISVIIGIIALMLPDAEESPITSSGGEYNPFGQSGERDFGTQPGSPNPFGESGSEAGSPAPITPSGTVADGRPQLRRIFTPATGASVFSAIDAGGEIADMVRFTERASGHIYQGFLRESAAPWKVTNTTIPRVQSSHWAISGSSTAFQYLDGQGGEAVSTFIGRIESLPESDTPSEEERVYKALSGKFLPMDVTEMTFSPDGGQVAYLLSEGAGSTLMIVRGDAAPEALTRLPLRDMTISWPTPETIYVTSKTSAFSNGFSFAISVATGARSLVLGDVPGLALSVNPSGTRILYFSTNRQTLGLQSLNLESGMITRLPLVTLPEKCAWESEVAVICGVPTQTPDNQFPDAWYRGEQTLTDLIWRINVDNGTTDFIIDPKGTLGVPLDLTNVVVAPSREFVTFIDKPTNTLWSVYIPKAVTFGETQSENSDAD